ncbi:TMEM165/GDT1 family protein [Dokdonella immobilis]|uniref:GDT1 family protein n=1 Tax=Dokdonella immobilis TaxID=578942 RepID=A0A1I4XT94_9GAMM|nr:TMEM165/GDT1 family protein [Dokdonella immobilis]SFN29088.1 Putative Ca2+/H+ antiporter, TMEM165/GDT1 family [Dokdonella immobilis]
MQTLFISTAAVAIAEIGDKTQLLSLILAAKYRRPLPICIGIFVATLLNHALAGWFGAAIAAWLQPSTLTWIVALSFFAIALWTLVPDKVDGDDVRGMAGHGVLVATVIAFFLAEMGDKTQVATVVLAARYSPLWEVVAGTTIGMLLANVPVVWLGARFAQRLPLRTARYSAAALFAALAIWIVARQVVPGP